MALREFTDRTGCRWRVWDIRPEQMLSVTRSDESSQGVAVGWLAFQPDAGGAKRRLSPIPARWEVATEDQLERMLERADWVDHEGGSPRSQNTPAP